MSPRAPSRAAGVREQQKAATRAALVAAGRAVFTEAGFSGANVADVARRAGVAHGTFYVHFASKEQLLDELLAGFNADLVRRLEAAWPADALAEPSGAARRLAEVFLEAWAEARGLVAAFAERAGAAGGLPGLRDGISPPVAGFLEARLRRLASASGRALPHPGLVVQALLGMWTRVGLQALYAEGPGAPTRAEAADLLAALSLGALGALLPPLGGR